MFHDSWPLNWFFNGEIDYISDNAPEGCLETGSDASSRVDWRDLHFFGWSDFYLGDIDSDEISTGPGIYVIAHEYERPALYVGQSTDLRQRIFGKNHHKIPRIIELFESVPWGDHNRSNAKSEMRVLWKTLPSIAHEENIQRWLIWCEAIAIGLLCPLMQGNIADIYEKDWAIGRSMYI